LCHRDHQYLILLYGGAHLPHLIGVGVTLHSQKTLFLTMICY